MAVKVLDQTVYHMFAGPATAARILKDRVLRCDARCVGVHSGFVLVTSNDSSLGMVERIESGQADLPFKYIKALGPAASRQCIPPQK